jgi:dTDP-4-dehydrorhamnose reductase
VKILITGSYGQLGNALIDILNLGKSEIGSIPEVYKDANVTAVDYDVLDITNLTQVLNLTNSTGFDLIINAAAFTNVDACETEHESAMKVNAIGARNLAIAADLIGAKLVHISTDYVFGGTSETPYSEWDLPAPVSVYGKSKLLGEQYVLGNCAKSFVARTSWLYSYAGNNFVKTISELAAKNDSIRVVDDQVGNPTHAYDLAHHLLKIAATEEYGIFHCTGEGICSWFDFAKEIVALSGAVCEVVPCTTDEFPRPAPRPAYSAMDNLMLRSTVGNEMRGWKDALASYFKNKQ